MKSYPPQRASQLEQVVDTEAVEMLKCTPRARRIASETMGIVMGSEQVTKDDEFGYIFRYKTIVPVEDNGKVYDVSGSFVLYSKDSDTFQIATYSDFELPNPKSKEAE